MGELNTAYNHWRETITQDKNRGADGLVAFAKKFSANEKLQSEAVSLKSEFDLYSNEDSIQQDIVAEMFSLAEKIAKNSEPPPLSNDLTIVENLWLEKRVKKDIVFECTEVHKCYKRTNFKLKNISIRLKAGEITGIVGENGNGKTTLLKIIAGEIASDKGILSYPSLEGNTTAFEQWRYIKSQIAYVPQELGRLLGSTIQAVQYSASLHGITGTQNRKETDYIVERMGLGPYKHARWQELSGGFKLRFALATILVWKPKMIVLDEPLANLDINTQVRVLNDLHDLAKSIKNPIGVILSSQNIEEVEAVSDNMIVMKGGEIKYNWSIDSIGEHRKENQFEFKCDHAIDRLKELFQPIGQYVLYHNGFTFYITVPKTYTAEEFLMYCIKNGISLLYFQDISTSVKRFIVQTKPR
jgi:ABC-2 type transport system ATP-binding protein